MSKELSLGISMGLLLVLLIPQAVNATTYPICVNTTPHPTTMTLWWKSGLYVTLTDVCNGSGIVNAPIYLIHGGSAGIAPLTVADTQTGGIVQVSSSYHNGTAGQMFAVYLGNTTYSATLSDLIPSN